MADQKTTQMSSLATPAGEDLLMIIDDPSGAPVNKKITLSTLFGKVPSNLVVNGTVTANTNAIIISNSQTPANSTITIAKGSVFYDSDFIYVAVNANSLKRVPLSAF